MKKQNYISAISMVFIFGISLSYGYWLGKAEYYELLETYKMKLATEERDMHSRANRNMFILSSLEDKEAIERLKEFYLLLVKRDLEHIEAPSKTLSPEHNQVIYKPKETLVKKAKNYQSKYCSDKCLGI